MVPEPQDPERFACKVTHGPQALGQTEPSAMSVQPLPPRETFGKSPCPEPQFPSSKWAWQVYVRRESMRILFLFSPDNVFTDVFVLFCLFFRESGMGGGINVRAPTWAGD